MNRALSRSTACFCGLMILTSCSRQAEQPASQPTGNPGGVEQTGKAVESLSLNPGEQKALELYKRWAGFRENLQKHLMDNGQLKLLLTKDEASRDFANPMGDGVMPTTKEGMDTFNQQFDKAYAAEKVVRAEAAKIFAEIREQPPEVREVFWSLMAVHGIEKPALTRDGSKLVFIQSPRGSSTSVFEQDTVPLDPADTNPGDDIYVWDLATGTIDCVSTDASVWQRQLPVASVDGSVLAFLSVPGGDNKAERNITLRDGSGKLANILAEGPFAIENFADKPVNQPDRLISSPSISADGNKIAFLCGTYINLQREEGYSFENYYLCLFDRTSGKSRSLTQPVDQLAWPVLSGNGSKAVAFTTEKAFAIETGEPWKPGDPPSGPLALYLIPTDGSAPPKKIPLPDGVDAWKISLWDKKNPLSISDDGSKVAIEVPVGGKAQVYYYDDATGATKLVSATVTGQAAGENCGESMISGDGKSIVFASYAKDLNVSLPYKLKQIFVYDTATGALDIAVKDPSGKPLEVWCEAPSINADGSLISFLADTEMIPGALSPAIRSQVKKYKSKRLAVIQTADKKIITMGGRRMNP